MLYHLTVYSYTEYKAYSVQWNIPRDYVSRRFLEEQRSIKLAENAERAAAAVTAATAKKSRVYSKVKCFKRQKMGRIARNCLNKKENMQIDEDDAEEDEDENEDVTRIRTGMARTIGEHASFIVDSGVSSHIANSLDYLTNLEDFQPIKIQLTDDTMVEARICITKTLPRKLHYS